MDSFITANICSFALSIAIHWSVGTIWSDLIWCIYESAYHSHSTIRYGQSLVWYDDQWHIGIGAGTWLWSKSGWRCFAVKLQLHILCISFQADLKPHKRTGHTFRKKDFCFTSASGCNLILPSRSDHHSQPSEEDESSWRKTGSQAPIFIDLAWVLGQESWPKSDFQISEDRLTIVQPCNISIFTDRKSVV